MPTFRNKCGCWLAVPEESFASEPLYRQWYTDHHWPHCPQNPKRVPMPVTHVREKATRVRTVVTFSPDLHIDGVEVIPERPHEGVWRVLNASTRSWPIVRVGDWLDVTDVTNVQVIPADRAQAEFEVLADPQLAEH